MSDNKQHGYISPIDGSFVPTPIAINPDQPPASPQDKSELREKLAAIEHERWSDWQLWCHEVIRKNVGKIDELEDVLARWDRQAITPYDKLSDKEKASDMEQVDRYWPLIESYCQAAVRQKLDLLYWQYKENNHQSVDMTFVDAYNAVIAELEAQTGSDRPPEATQ